MECEQHPGVGISAVCVTCGTTLVCIDCITDELHQGHVFGKASKIANDIKTKLKTKETEYSNLVTNLESDLNEIRTLKTQQGHEQIDRVKSMNTRREVIIEAVNEVADSFISQYETQTRGNLVKLQDAIDDISTKLEILRRHRNDIKHIIAVEDDLTVVRESRIIQDININEQRKQYPDLDTFEFTPGKVNTNQLQIMFGSTAADIGELATQETLSTDNGSECVGSVTSRGRKLVLESSFNHSESNFVSTMCHFHGKTWVKCSDEKRITLTDRQGHVQKTVNFDSVVYSLTTASDNTVLVCGWEDRDIKQVTLPSGNVTSVFSTGELYPRGIFTMPGCDLYVILVDKHEVDYNVTAILVQYSPQGMEKARARQDKRGDDLFVRPLRVRISNTGNVIGVTNSTDKKNSHLVLLNADLTLRSRYLGNAKVMSEEKFDTTTYKPNAKYLITDFIFDSFDNIIICEAYSMCVQLLSSDCLPMWTILPTQGYVPWSMTMSSDEMWLGFRDGSVKLYKYEQVSRQLHEAR